MKRIARGCSENVECLGGRKVGCRASAGGLNELFNG